MCGCMASRSAEFLRSNLIPRPILPMVDMTIRNDVRNSRRFLDQDHLGGNHGQLLSRDPAGRQRQDAPLWRRDHKYSGFHRPDGIDWAGDLREFGKQVMVRESMTLASALLCVIMAHPLVSAQGPAASAETSAEPRRRGPRQRWRQARSGVARARQDHWPAHQHFRAGRRAGEFRVAHRLRRAIAIRRRQASRRRPPRSSRSWTIAPTSRKRKVFSGWMRASSPSLNGLQHPLYDVWVISCKTNQPGQVAPVVASTAPVRATSPDAGAKEAAPELPEGSGQ